MIALRQTMTIVLDLIGFELAVDYAIGRLRVGMVGGTPGRDRPGRTETVPPIRLGLQIFSVALLIMTVIAGSLPARAQGKLDAEYLVTLAGIPIGKGRWVIDISEDRYTASANGATAGLLRLFAGGEGNSSSQGAMVGGVPVSAGFNASITANKSKEEFHITMEGGAVKDFSVEPPPPPSNERVPVTDAHRRGVNDPMTASLIRVPGNVKLLGPDACPRLVSVFDGRYRYDLQLAYKRIDQISADKGYAGPAVVCAVNFVPVAGHIPDKPAIKYIMKQRDMEIWLAPIAGTRVVVPFRVSIPTPFGVGIMQATEFVSVAHPRATAATAKVP